MPEKMKGVYTDGINLITVDGYNAGNLKCSKLEKEIGNYKTVGYIELTSTEFYQNYEICGYRVGA